jgi:hypothetical protein
MAGLLDFLGLQSGGGGLLGLGSNPLGDAFGGNQGMILSGLGLAGGATPAEGFKNMMPALQQAYEQQNAQRAGMALLECTCPAATSLRNSRHRSARSGRARVMQSQPRLSERDRICRCRAASATTIRSTSRPGRSRRGFRASQVRMAALRASNQPEQGIDAANSLLDTYQNKYGLQHGGRHYRPMGTSRRE